VILVCRDVSIQQLSPEFVIGTPKSGFLGRGASIVAAFGGRVAGAPCWSHENARKRTEPGVPGVTPSRFVILRELGKSKRGLPALSMSLSEATPGGRDSGAPFWNYANLSERTEPGVPGVTPSRFVILGEFR
jgi:hypothetical protein